MIPATGDFMDPTCMAPNAGPDLQISKSDGGITSFPGGIITYTIFYTNAGTKPATRHRHHRLPAGQHKLLRRWRLDSGQRPVHHLCRQPGVWSERIGAFSVRVNNPVPAGVHSVTNTVSIRDDGANGVDLNPADNTASDFTPLGTCADANGDSYANLDAAALPRQLRAGRHNRAGQAHQNEHGTGAHAVAGR